MVIGVASEGMRNENRGGYRNNYHLKCKHILSSLFHGLPLINYFFVRLHVAAF